MTSDRERLQSYVDTWEHAVRDTAALLRELDPDDWTRATDLPGWDVRAVAAHLAHLESELAGHPQEQVDVPEAAHITSWMGAYTEKGPLARSSWSTGQIVDEFEASSAIRLKALREDPPTDGAGAPPTTPGDIGWNWETLLSNRPLDVWMHEQDIRRAVGRPGGLDSRAAAHTVRVLTRSLPYVVGKRVGAPPGTSVVLDVTGPQAVHVAVAVGDDGRGAPLAEDPDEPSVTLRMDVETFVVLAGGRRRPEDVQVEVSGDEALAARILASMAVTP